MPYFLSHPNFGGGSIFSLIILFLIIDIILRGMALWNSARNSQKGWFICLMIFNTLGILPLIYLLGFNKKK